RAVLRRERRRAWWPALLLRPLLPDWRWRLALLAFLLLALPWMSAHWLGDARDYLDWWRQLGVQRDTLQLLQRALPSLLVYALLVIGGAQLLARHVSQDERALLRGFAQRPLALLQFASDSRHDAAYPYRVTRAPWPLRELQGRWQLAAAHGDLFGARMLALHDGAEPEPQVQALLVLPDATHAAALIPIAAELAADAQAQLHALALAVATAAAAASQPIAELHRHVDAWMEARSQQRMLLQRLQSMDA
ncbi:ATPase AAA, partial [Xanthomonas translucens DAR61454]